MATTQQLDVIPGISGEASDFYIGSTSPIISNLNVYAMIEKLFSHKQSGKQHLLVLINTLF